MWIIKYIDKNTCKEKVVMDEKFDNYNEAFNYIEENMPDIDDVWPEEELITNIASDRLDFETLIGKYIYVMSKKTNDFFCYGIIKSISVQFIYIQTRPEQQEIFDFAFYRTEKIKDLYANNSIKFEDNGCFVSNLRDYL